MFLGLDLGTSGLRAILLAHDGVVLDSASAKYPLNHPERGWSEQTPRDWITALGRAVQTLRTRQPKAVAGLRGIGLSGQMHGAVLLDRAGSVLRPAILWNDSRAAAEAARLDAAPRVREITQNAVFPGFTAPKLIWLATHEPEVFAAVSTVLLPKDYLGFYLTGIRASEMSDASGTAWLDVRNRVWSDEMLAKSGLSRDQVPPLLEGTGIIGALRPEVAADLGLPPGVQVVAGGGDNAAAACGIGALNEGAGFVSLGTSGVVLLARGQCTADPAHAVHTFCHALPERWIQMGVMLAATDSLNWLARLLGKPPEALSAALSRPITGPSRLQFLPYLSGERTPHNDSSVRGAFVGLDIADDAPDLTQAVIEGVCFALAQSLDALVATGARPASLVVLGGGSASHYWLETLATILDLPLELPVAGADGAALGAARLALAGVGGVALDAAMPPPPLSETIEPRRDLRAAYAAAYHRYRALYPAIRSLP